MQNVLAETYALVNRFVTVVEKFYPSQINLLSQKIHVRFMHDVKIISDAINYLLHFKSKMILSCSNGWADLEKHQAIQPDSLFRLAINS